MRFRIVIFIILIGSSYMIFANDEKEAIEDIISHISEVDSSKFKVVCDTLAYFGGRDVGKALSIALDLNKRVIKLENEYFKTVTLLKLSHYYLLKGDPDASKQHLDLGLKRAIAVQDTSSIISFYYQQGWLNMELNRPEKAQESYYEGLRLSMIMHKYPMQISLLSNLSLTYKNLKDKDNEYKYLKQAVDVGKKNNLTETGSFNNALYNLAGYQQQNGNVDTAIVIYNELSSIYKRKNYTSGLASIANNMSHVYREKGDYESALREGFKALKYDELTGTKMYIISDLITIAKVYRSKGDVPNAIRYYKKADSISVVSGMISQRIKITLAIAELYADANYFEKAFQSMQEHLKVCDEFNILETNRQVKEIEEKFKVEQKENENKILRTSQSKDKRIIQLQYFIIGLLIFVVLIAGILMFFNVSKSKKIRKLNNTLNDQNSELQENNNAKDQLFSMLSHDLRGPIGNLYALLQEINSNEDNLSLKDARFYLNITEKELHVTYELLENMLYWSRAQLGRIQVNSERINLLDIVKYTLKPYMYAAKNKEIAIDIQIDELSFVECDREMLSFIIRNIFSNALKFTYQKGMVSFSSKMVGDECSLMIDDNGIGMSKQVLSELFINENHKSRKGTNDEKGNGLGLILCKEFADMNRIDINVESEESKGTSFSLRFTC